VEFRIQQQIELVGNNNIIATTSAQLVDTTLMSMFGSRAFSVASPTSWNSLLNLLHDPKTEF